MLKLKSKKLYTAIYFNDISNMIYIIGIFLIVISIQLYYLSGIMDNSNFESIGSLTLIFGIIIIMKHFIFNMRFGYYFIEQGICFYMYCIKKTLLYKHIKCIKINYANIRGQYGYTKLGELKLVNGQLNFIHYPWFKFFSEMPKKK